MQFLEILSRMVALKGRRITTLKGKWNAKRLVKLQKNIAEDEKLLKEAWQHYNIEKIESVEKDMEKNLKKAFKKGQNFFKIVTVKRDHYFTLLHKFNDDCRDTLSELYHKKFILKDKVGQRKSLITKKMKDTKATIMTELWEEYQDIEALIKADDKANREEARATFIFALKKVFKQEKAGYGKYFLMRHDVKELAKIFKQAKEEKKRIISEMLAMEKAKTPEKAEELWKKSGKEINEFFKEVKKAMKYAFLAVKRDLLIMFLMVDELRTVIQMDKEMEGKEIIPPAMAEQLIQEFQVIREEIKDHFRTDAEVIRREQAAATKI